MYKLVAIDMDETLLNDDAEISPKNVSGPPSVFVLNPKPLVNTTGISGRPFTGLFFFASSRIKSIPS